MFNLRKNVIELSSVILIVGGDRRIPELRESFRCTLGGVQMFIESETKESNRARGTVSFHQDEVDADEKVYTGTEVC